ncbi:MAG: UDP-N-acetylmuramoyl-L-alanyl-D-glutamate--2,6-diaminopimelate ligase, partial [Alphaproteobacteria bacterium MarineAlpha3_Bin4]
MRLIDVLKGAHDQVTQGATNIDTEITGLTCDSRRVEPGFLFAALPGSQADGRSFIPEALARGASAVLGPTGTAFDDAANVLLITDDNPRREYALMAARFFTGQPTTIAAVTGTNGKTSVVSFLRQLWAQLGHRSASAGTLGIELAGFGDVKPDHEHDFNLTTPDPVDLHRSLSELCAAGVERLALEASSHGLQQCRLDGLRVTVAAFTNLTRDHLDYHGTMEDYLGAKLRLFSDVTGDDGVVVINADAAYSDAVEAASWGSGHRIMTYGQAGTDVRLLSVGSCAKGQHLNLEVAGDLVQVTLPLVG